MATLRTARVASRLRAPIGGWFAVGVVLLVNAVFVLNNLAPYLGLNYAGAMSMYSGLAETGDNHLLMPKAPIDGAFDYVSVVQVDATRDRGVAEVRLFEQLATPDEPPPLVNLNAVRYHVRRACASEPRLRLRLKLQTQAGQQINIDNTCADPTMHRYAPVTSYAPCGNRTCRRAFERWLENDVFGN